MERLSSLKEWDSALEKCPYGICLEGRSKKELPPDNGHVALAVAGSAMAATAVAVSGCIPILAPIVAPTMLPVATGMFGKGFQRNIQTNLKLERSIEQGQGSGPPSCRGPGGHGGRGGEFYVAEARHEVKKMA